MTDKEFRRLRRPELVEIIYKLQEDETGLRSEIDSLKAQLEEKELKLSEAGSIADAAMKVNGVFESAQAAADQYLVEIKRLQAETKVRTEQMLAEAKTKEEEIISEAKQKSEAMLAEAEQKRNAVLLDANQKETEAKVRQSMLLSEGQTQHDKMLAEAKSQSDAILAQAQAKHDELISTAEQETAQKWQAFDERVRLTLEQHAALRSLMESLQERH